MATHFDLSGPNKPFHVATNEPIKEGMIVVDASNLPVGVITASLLHRSSAGVDGNDAQPTPQPTGRTGNGSDGANGANDANGNSRLIPTIAGHFLQGEKLPELLFVRLQRTGFLRVERPGLYSRTYYVTPDQIESVSRKRIKLSVLRETLLSY